MTKKHFELVAKVLNNRAKAITNSSATNEEKHYALFELKNTMYHFCDEFEEANSKFDGMKFLEACNIERHLINVKVEIISS